ncbi:MAG: hypothetical protein M3529_08225, partial [Actinomycetota bacterium]|nr:hypothetical protein [Actinomycetota bacterium]
MAGSPLSLVVALLAYAGAFCLPTWTWCHVLPLRLGEVLRVSSVVRRTDVALQPTAASTVALWLTDLLTVALAVAPTVLAGVVGTAWALALT